MDTCYPGPHQHGKKEQKTCKCTLAVAYLKYLLLFFFFIISCLKQLGLVQVITLHLNALSSNQICIVLLSESCSVQSKINKN